ncbi:MAG: membrane protein insertase YidC, partial [Dongiaceae bacterium]
FWFLTKPLFLILDTIFRFVGNFGVAILCLTVLVKAVMFPLANKSYRSMSKMKILTPKMQELRAKHGDDKAKLNQEMIELYKREKVNPASGCLPIVVQIPVFYALYKVIYVTIEMRHAPFFGWIKDLSAPDPTSVLNLFGLIPWDYHQLFQVPVAGGFLHILSIGVWPLIMGFTMWLQMRLNPTPPDPVQAKIFALMPIIFTFMLAPFSAGLVIYWAWNNTLSIAQQRLIMWRMGVKP